MEMGGKRCILVLLLVFEIVSLIAGKISLNKISTTYVPFTYINGSPQFRFNEGALETLAYDPKEMLVYTAGRRLLQVIDISSVKYPQILFHILFGENSEANDVEVCGDFVIVVRVDKIRKERGFVDIYRKYNRYTDHMDLLHTIVVGSGPDHIRPTSDCRKILISIEGEVYGDGTHLIDPLGGVGVISIRSTDLSKMFSYTMVDFTSFVDRTTELVRKGVRYVFRSPNNTIANDLEPETITLNGDETKAFIALQENNAIAEFDMQTDKITAIHPLGYKDWRKFKFDASDRDNGIIIRPWPVFGMYLPDSIEFTEINGQGVIISANEGDSKDYSNIVPNGFNEESRVEDLTISASSPIRTWAKANGFGKEITAAENLGRLKVTNVDGRLPSLNEYRNLFSFGSRSFSIWRASDKKLLYDSGSDFEQILSRFRPKLFNTDAGSPDEKVIANPDIRSDNKGPEPETIAIGDFRGKKLIAVGFERPGGIFIYSINKDTGLPQFEDVWIGTPLSTETWTQLYNKRSVSEIDVEALRFVQTHESPNGQILLIAAGSVSGTVSIFQIKDSSKRFTCRRKPSGMYADPYDCRKYYRCRYGAKHLSCPKGLYFNGVQKYCDFPKNVVC